MVSGDTVLERRGKKRYEAKGGCLVILGGDPIKPWQILDISEEGLAFRYIGGAAVIGSTPHLDIRTSDPALGIARVPFQVISDLDMPSKGRRRYSLRRCGIQFGQLTPEQSGQVRKLIESL